MPEYWLCKPILKHHPQIDQARKVLQDVRQEHLLMLQRNADLLQTHIVDELTWQPELCSDWRIGMPLDL